MKKSTPPFITPFAILSVIVLIGTSNLVVNRVTHTHEGAPVRSTRTVNNPNQQTRPNSPVRQSPNSAPQRSSSADSGTKRSAEQAPERSARSPAGRRLSSGTSNQSIHSTTSNSGTGSNRGQDVNSTQQK